MELNSPGAPPVQEPGRAGGVQPGEGSKESSDSVPVPKGDPGELERNWMEGQETGNGFQVKERRFRWDLGRILPWEGAETLE